VLTNVLDNALKYSPGGGAVAVTVRAEGAGAAVAVRDAGIGLPPGAEEAIFAPFGRATNAVASSVTGMGLGLYICRTIVERHGGWIRAVSPGVGEGTTVTFWLPTDGPPGEG
jgi:signal transduction histidine kinase